MARGDIQVIPLSGSTNGKLISVTGSNTGNADTIHTASARTGELDLVTIYANNLVTSSPQLTLAWGGTSASDLLRWDLAWDTSEVATLIDSFPIRNGLAIKAYTSIPSSGRLGGVARRYFVESSPTLEAGDSAIIPLSGSTDGRPILITGTATGTAVTIHTATANANTVDLISLWAGGETGPSGTLTLEWGGTSSGDLLQQDLDFQTAGIYRVARQLPLENGLAVTAYNSTASGCSLIGYVERIYTGES